MQFFLFHLAIDFHEFLGFISIHQIWLKMTNIKNDWGSGNWQTVQFLQLIFLAKTDYNYFFSITTTVDNYLFLRKLPSVTIGSDLKPIKFNESLHY